MYVLPKDDIAILLLLVNVLLLVNALKATTV